MIFQRKNKFYVYDDVPFPIRNCQNCDMEIPRRQKYCNICAELLLEQKQFEMWKTMQAEYIKNRV